MTFLNKNLFMMLLLVGVIGSCKARNDGSLLKEDQLAQTCDDPVTRLNCNYELNVTHDTGGNCTTDYMSQLLGKGKQGGGLNLFNQARVYEGGYLKKMRAQIVFGEFREQYICDDVSQGVGERNCRFRRVVEARPMLDDNGPISFSWELQGRYAPTNVRTLLSLIDSKYFLSGKPANGKSDFGVLWNSYQEDAQKEYSDVYDYYGEEWTALKRNDPQFKKALGEISVQPNFRANYMKLLAQASFSVKDKCQVRTWLRDQIKSGTKLYQENHGYGDQSNQRSLDQGEASVFEVHNAMNASHFFRRYDFGMWGGKVPFFGSRLDMDPFFTVSEAHPIRVKINAPQGTPQGGVEYKSETLNAGEARIYFGDLVVLSDSSTTKSAFPKALATKLAINPYKAWDKTKRPFKPLPTNEEWHKELKGSPIPTVVGSLIGGVPKMVSLNGFLAKVAESVANKNRIIEEVRGKIFGHLSSYSYALLEQSSTYQELQTRLNNAKTPEEKKKANAEIAAYTSVAKIPLRHVKRIVEASKYAYYNDQVLSNQQESEDDFASIFGGAVGVSLDRAIAEAFPNTNPTAGEVGLRTEVPGSQSLAEVQKMNDAIIAKFVQQIIAERPANATPVVDIRPLDMSYKTYDKVRANRDDLPDIIPGEGLLDPRIQREFGREGME